MQFKVRPFTKIIEFGSEVTAPLSCHGAIVGDQYQLRFGPFEHSLAGGEVGADSFGPFAHITPGTYPLAHGFVLSVEAEAEEPLLTVSDNGMGCRITLNHPRDQEQAASYLTSVGIDADRFNIIVPPDYGVSIYFHESGACTGSSGITSGRPPDEGARVIH
jgi:hypothetical protein